MRRHAGSGVFVRNLAIQDVFFTRPMCAWIGHKIRACLVVLCVLGIGIAITFSAHAGHEFPKSCPSGVEYVTYPEQYGWFPCPAGSWGCQPFNDAVIQFLATHPTADEACRDLHLTSPTAAGWVKVGDVCAYPDGRGGYGSFTYALNQMPYCRDPHDGRIRSIDRWGGGPGPCWYLRCKDTNRYFIKLVRRTGSPESGSVVTSVEPDKTSDLAAYVYNQNGQYISSAKVQLEITEVVPNSGGHRHHEGRPKGTLNGGQQIKPDTITGGTGNGGFAFSFTAPAAAGDHKLKATCTDRNCTLQGPDTVWVGIKNLIPLPAINSYVLLPNQDRDENHPDNHYMTYDAHIKLMQLADLYRRNFPGDPKLHINDASLVRGGLFDLAHNWSIKPRGHKSHRHGKSVDIRANSAKNPGSAIPTRNFQEFKWIAKEIGGDAEIHSPGDPLNQHFHVEY